MAQTETIRTPQDFVNYTFNVQARGIAELSSELAGLSNTASNLLGLLAFKTSEFLTNTESLAMGAGGAISAVFASATESAITFEQQIANVQAIGGETVNAGAIGAAAMEYSNKFGMATSSMTEGLESLARAGITTTDVMKGVLEEGVKLSKLEGMDLEDSINDLISTTNLLSVDDVDMNDPQYAQMVKDMNQHIVSTSESAPIDAQNIIQSLQHVGGYASASGIDQDDLFAVIAQLGSRGTKGEMAGTALRAFVSAGQKDTAQRALARIGLNVEDLWSKTGETMLPISEMKNVLDEALEKRGYSQQEKLEFYSDFAGYKQANQIMKIDTSEVQQYKESIANAWDLGKKLDTILGTVRGNLDRINQIMHNFMTKVGTQSLKILNIVLTPLRMMLELITKIPFVDKIAAFGMLFVAFRTGLMIFNKITPALFGFLSGIEKVEGASLSLRGAWKGTVDSVSEAKEILTALIKMDQKELSKKHYETHGLSAKNRENAEHIVAAQMYLGSDFYRRTKLRWEQLDVSAQDMILERYKGTDEFKKNYEAYVRLTKKSVDDIVSDPIIIEDFSNTDALDSINEWVKQIFHLMSNGRNGENENDEPGGRRSNESGSGSNSGNNDETGGRRSSGSGSGNNSGNESGNGNETSGGQSSRGSGNDSSDSGPHDNRNRNTQADIISRIMRNYSISSGLYGNYEFAYRGDDGFAKLKAQTEQSYRDLERKIKSFSNTNFAEIDEEQKNVYRKLLYREATSPQGKKYAAMSNESEVRFALERGRIQNNNRRWYQGIRDRQIRVMGKALGINMDDFHETTAFNDQRGEYISKIHRAINKMGDEEKRNFIDSIVLKTNEIWDEEVTQKSTLTVDPRKILANDSLLAQKVAQALNLNEDNSDVLAEHPGEYAKAVHTFFLDEANRNDTAMVDKATEVLFENLKYNEQYSMPEEREIRYVVENLQKLRNTFKYFVDNDMHENFKEEMKTIVGGMDEYNELFRSGGEELGNAIVEGFVVEGLGIHSPGFMYWAYINEQENIKKAISQSKDILSKESSELGSEISSSFNDGLQLNTFDNQKASQNAESSEQLTLDSFLTTKNEETSEQSTLDPFLETSKIIKKAESNKQSTLDQFLESSKITKNAELNKQSTLDQFLESSKTPKRIECKKNSCGKSNTLINCSAIKNCIGLVGPKPEQSDNDKPNEQTATNEENRAENNAIVKVNAENNAIEVIKEEDEDASKPHSKFDKARNIMKENGGGKWAISFIDLMENIHNKIKSGRDSVINGFANKTKNIDNSKANKEYLTAIGKTKDNIDKTTSKMKEFHSDLIKLSETFPMLSGVTLVTSMAIKALETATIPLKIAEDLLEGSRVFSKLATLGLIEAEQAKILQESTATVATEIFTLGIKSLTFIMSNPAILIGIAAVIAAIAAVKTWETKHAEALKKTQKALEESVAKNNVAVSQYEDLKKARESETDAMKRQKAARREAIALYELEASRIQTRKAVKEEAKVRNDAVWGEYGLRASLQKMGLGFIAGGDFESQYEKYDGTTANIRQIKEDSLGNLFASPEQQYISSLYDNNSQFFAEVEAYQKPLQELYDKESRLIEQYGSINDARSTEDFEEAVQEFANATGINGKTAVKMLNWLETENKVNQASQVGEAEIGIIMARRQAQLMEIEYGDQFSDANFNDVGNVMLMAQFREMMNNAKTEVWWDLLFSYLDLIVTAINPLNWLSGDVSKKLAIIEANQDTLGLLNEKGNNIYNDMLEAYNNSERRDYGSGISYSTDTPFGGAIESAAVMYAEKAQQKYFAATGSAMNEEEYIAVQNQYTENTFNITNKKIQEEKVEKDIEAQKEAQKNTSVIYTEDVDNQSYEEETKIVENTQATIEQLQDNGEQAHEDALSIIDAIKNPGVVSGVSASVNSLRSSDSPVFKSIRRNGLDDVFKWMSGEEGTFTGKVFDYVEPKTRGVRAAYADDGVSGVYEYGKGLASKGIGKVKGGLSTLKSEAIVAKDVYKTTGLKGLTGYGEGMVYNGIDRIKGTKTYNRISNRIAFSREMNNLAADGLPVYRDIIDKGVAVYDGAKAAYANDGLKGVASFSKDTVKNGIKNIPNIGKNTYGELGGVRGVVSTASAEVGGVKGLASTTASGMKDLLNPKAIAGEAGSVAKGLKGGGTLMKGIGRLGGRALAFLGPALAFTEKASELNPMEKHYNEDGTEKKALQATGEVVGTTAGALGGVAGGMAGAEAGAALGATIGSVIPGIGTVIGGAVGAVAGGIAGGWLGDTIFQPIGDAIGGTIGWLGDNLLGGIQNVAGTVWNGLSSAAGAVWDTVSGVATGAWDFVTSGATSGIGIITGITDWLFGGGEDPYANTEEVMGQKMPQGGSKSENTIVIENININTEDDPEKIKSALMNLIIEMQEQISPRQVSRTVGDPPSKAAPINQNGNNMPQTNGVDNQNNAQNNNNQNNNNPTV